MNEIIKYHKYKNYICEIELFENSQIIPKINNEYTLSLNCL